MDIAKIETFGLKDNDVVIIRVQGGLSDEQRKAIGRTWSEVFEQQGYKNVKVIVLNETVGIQIITKKD